MTRPRIRPARSDDAAACAEIYRPYVTDTAISFELDPPDPAEMAGRIERFSPYRWLIAEAGGDVAGYAYASPHAQRAAYAPSVDVAVYVRQGSARQGIGRALYEDLFAALDGRFHAMFAGITLPNEASVGLHESFGFTPVGIYREVGRKFDRWHDVGWWQRLI